MATKPPAFQFYAKDWLTSKAVIAMTPTQRGYYIMLLAHAWDSDNPGELENNPNLLWRLAGAGSKKEFDKVSPLVLAQFDVGVNGNLINSKLKKINLERRKFLRKQSVNGKRGGAPKGNINALKDLTENPESTQNQPKTSSSSSSSSSFALEVEPKALPQETLTAFDDFWSHYPKRVGKQEARKAWGKIPGVEKHSVEIILSVEQWKLNPQWSDPQFIPYPATFLNNKRWEDEITNGTPINKREQGQRATLEAARQVLERRNNQEPGDLRPALLSEFN